jgi:hypothetical protein
VCLLERGIDPASIVFAGDSSPVFGTRSVGLMTRQTTQRMIRPAADAQG